MGLITLFVYSTIILLLLWVILPHFFLKILKYALKLQHSEMKIYNLNHFKGIFFKTSNKSFQIWGISSIILNIPDLVVKISKFKIKIFVNRMQIFLIKEKLQLHKVRIIDGMMEPNLLINFLQYILEKTNLKQIFQQITKKEKLNQTLRKQKESKKNQPKNRFLIILEGSLQFLIMMILQQFQVIFEQASVNITASVPENNPTVQSNLKKQEQQHFYNCGLNFSCQTDKKQSLLLLQYMAQETLLIPKIQIAVQIINHHQQQIQVYLSQYQLINWTHVNQPFLTGKQIRLGVRIPFMLDFKESLKRIQFKMIFEQMNFDTIPQDYENLIKFIKSNTFDLNQLFHFCFRSLINQNIDFISSQNDQKFVKVCLDIKNVRVKLHSLFQINHDSLHAKQYLANIKEAIVNFQNVSLKENKFQIKYASLNVFKFAQNFSDSSSQRQVQTSMIIIPNLLITINQGNTVVFHEQAQLICEREQVTLLGKLFILINNRMSLDQYQIMQYFQTSLKYFDYRKVKKQNFEKNQIAKKLQKQELISFLFFYFSNFQKPYCQLQSNISKNLKQKTFKYIPQSLHFRLKIQKLQHQLVLNNPSYQQKSVLGEEKHFLKINSLFLIYMGTKQFGITKLDFIFRQISTLHELGLFIQSIHMKQNQLTFIEYLCGWTVLKKLLQLNQKRENCEQDFLQNVSQYKAKGKLSKKTISIKKIHFQYNQQTIVVKELKVQKNTLQNGKTSKLYFSLDRCQLNSLLKYNVNNFKRKIFQQINENTQNKQADLKKKHNKKKQLNQKSGKNLQNFINFTVFSIDSVTMNTTLKIFQKRLLHHKSIEKQKQRSLIHIKNPQINLPYFDASYKLTQYLKTYAEMIQYIQAYLKNVTDDEIIKIRKNIRQFLIQPQSILLKITNFGITIQQLPLDNHLQNFNRLIREYLSKIQYQNLVKISELQILSNINKNKKISHLCSLKIQEISFQINPFDSITSQDKSSIDYWIENFHKKLVFKQKKSQISCKKIQSQKIRLRKIYAQNYKVQIKNVEFRLRDYPKSLLILSSFNSQLSILTTCNIFNSKKYHFLGNLNIGCIEANIGLGMISGFLQILNKFTAYTEVLDKFKKTQDFLSNFKNKSKNKKSIDINRIQKGFQPWWHILFYSSYWSVKVKKQPTVINLYTGITPYMLQHFKIQIGKFQATSQREFSQLLINNFKIKLEEIEIIKLENINFNSTFLYDQNLNFTIKFQILTQKKGDIILHKDTIDFITQIKQLRKDWLLIFGLTQNYHDSLKVENQSLTKQKMNYFKIVKLAADNMLEKSKTRLSFFSVLKQIQLNCKINNFQISISNNLSLVQLCIKNLSFNHQVFVHNKIIMKTNQDSQKSNWEILKSNLQMQTIMGKFFQINQSANQYLKRQNQIIFLVSELMQIKFNQYMTVENELFYIKKYMTNRFLKIFITLKIKKQLQKLLQSFSTQKILKFANQNKKKTQKNIKPLDKFKKAVYKVIKINKLSKLDQQKCKILTFLSVFKKIQIIMESNKNTMILSSENQSLLSIFVKYHKNDMLFDYPFENIQFKLKKASIFIDEEKKRARAIINTQKNSKLHKVSFSEQLFLKISLFSNQINSLQLSQLLKNQMYKQIQLFSKGKITLKEGCIELTPKNKNLLKQFSHFIIEITDNKQQKKKEFKRIFDKYGQMMRHGRQKLKNKIQWNHSDIIEKQEQITTFYWLFQLKKMSITLYNQIKQNIKIQYGQTAVLTSNKPFLKIQSENISFNLILFDNEKMKTNIQISNLRILNLLEQFKGSEFQQTLSMNIQDKLAFSINACSYDIRAFSDLVWDYYSEIHIHLNPIKIKFTQQLYQILYTFLFPNNQANQQSLITQTQNTKVQEQDAYSSYIPDYIKKLHIDEVKLQIWYKTDSVLKRMDGINVNLKQFMLNNQFFTKKQNFDSLTTFILKQLAGQIFSVIGQKIFGSQ